MNDFKSIYKKSISLVFILFCFNVAFSQTNLVANYSFELFTICPTVTNAALPNSWYSAGKVKNVGYVNACNPDPAYTIPTNGGGYQFAKTGNGYIGLNFINGLNQNNRNYIQTKLLDSLSIGHCYYFEFFVSLGNEGKYGCNNIGLLLTNSAVYVDTISHPNGVLPANPQIINYGNPIVTDTMNWVKVSGVYVAQGGEQYITIGNFKTDAQTSYKQIQPSGYNGAGYYIDDVSVIPLDSMPLKANAGKDTTIANIGDSAFIGSLTNGLTGVKWYNANGNEITNQAGVPGFYAKPIASTFYIIEQTVCGYYSRDTVNVSVGTVPLKFISYNLVSSLRGTKQSVENIWTTANEINVSNFNIQRSTNSKDFTTIGKLAAQNKITNEYIFSHSPPVEGSGVVYYRIESVDFDGRKQYTETRIINLKPQTLNGVSIYPNPAKDYLNISSQENIKEIKIINQIGRVLEHQTPNSKQITINTKQIIKGVYIVQ